MKKLFSLCLVCMMALALVACSTPKTETTDPTSEPSASGSTYTSTQTGMNGPVTVEVTFDGDKIASAEVTDHQETPGIGGELKNINGEVVTGAGDFPVVSIPAEVVAYQSVNVDSVTGATVTSAAVKAGIKDCVKQAGLEDKFNVEVTQDAAKEETLDTDVVVIGGGGAGLAAAISASQNGAKVIVLEKNGAVGGDTLVCGAIYNTPDEALQSVVEMSDATKKTVEDALAATPVSDEHAALMAEVQKEWDEYVANGSKGLFDTVNWFTLQTYNGGDHVADLDLVKVLCQNSYEGYQWIESLGMKFNDVIGQGAGSLWQRTHTSTMQMGTGFISTYVDNIMTDDNVTIMVNTSGDSLIQDDTGKVVGVKATDKDGNTYTINTTKGVVLATGGFAANSDMIAEYNTSDKWSATDLSQVMTTNRQGCSQGEGITMALSAGASLTDMDQIQLLYLGNIQNGQLTKYPPRVVNGTDQEIFINKEGERFVREDGRRDEICLGVLTQTDSMFYFLESADGAGYVDINDPDWRSADGFTFDYLLENGFVIEAETLDEMAEKLGCDPDTLKATVDTFNASVDSGSDTLGRTLFTTKLENGPWVATARTACLHHTMGGVTIDTKTHVLDADGNVIEGLVAAGEVTGGIHGGNRLGGNAVVDTVVFGKLAGETISK